MLSRISLFLSSWIVSCALQAAPIFEASTHCMKDGAFYVGCGRQTQTLSGTRGGSVSLKILQTLPQKWRIGYRFHCSRVTGFGDFDARLTIGSRVIGLNRSPEPMQQELTLLLEPGMEPLLDVGTSKRSTRLVENCRFDLTSVTVFPLTETTREIFELVAVKKQVADYLHSSLDSSASSLHRTLGYLDARKLDWTGRISRAQKLIDYYRLKIEGLESQNALRFEFEQKVSDQQKSKIIYEEELAKLNLVLANPAGVSLLAYADEMWQSYSTDSQAFSAYLDSFSAQESSVEVAVDICSIDPQRRSCGE